MHLKSEKGGLWRAKKSEIREKSELSHPWQLKMGLMHLEICRIISTATEWLHTLVVIMIDPLNHVLPSLVALLMMPTCNKFTTCDVKNQWSLLEDLHAEYLLPVLGPLVGHASDGDARRRKDLMEQAFDASQTYTVGHPNFRIHASVRETPEGSYVYNLMDQDFIHNAKKLVNPLDHSKHVLSINGNVGNVQGFTSCTTEQKPASVSRQT